MKKILFLAAFICSTSLLFGQLKVEAAGVKVGAETTPVEALDVEGAVKLGTTATSNAGTLRWTGTDFEGYDGTNWIKFAGVGSSMWGNSSGAAFFNGGNVIVGGTDPGIANFKTQGTSELEMALDALAGNADFTMQIAGITKTQIKYNIFKDGFEFKVDAANTDVAISGLSSIFLDGTGAKNVAVGNEDPQEKLHVEGNVLADAYLTPAPFTSGGSSSRSFTNNSKGLKDLMRVQTYSYEATNGRNKAMQNYGVNADELAKVLPELVSEIQVKQYTDAADGESSTLAGTESYKVINSSAFTYILINAVQEQQAMIAERDDKIKQLEDRMDRLESRVSKTKVINKNN